MGKRDAVLLRARRIATLELQIDLPHAQLPLDVARPHQRRVADLGIDNVFKCFHSLTERTIGIRRDRAPISQLVGNRLQIGRRPIERHHG